MSDIFISYASADRDRARMLAEALAERGWKVWWDRTIPPGKEFDEVIEEALDASQCVVVLWSNASVASTWVKTEAAEAMRRKILVPALIDTVRIPLEFRRLQAADLSDWRGERSHEELEHFFQSIEANVGHAGSGTVQPEPVPAKPGTPHVEPAPEPAPPRAELPAAPPPITRAETPAPRAGATRWIPVIAGVVALVVGVTGYLAYNEHAKRVALEEKAAQDRRAAEEARSAAEAAAARARAAQAEAERHAAQRKLEEQRRAAEDAARATRERAAREKVEQERLAREKAERERTAREKVERERLARETAERERAESLAREERQKKSAKGPSSMKLAWQDNALRFSGVLTVSAGAGTLRAAAQDLRTGERIGSYDVPVTIVRQGPADYVVTGSFAVPGDSITPGPHTHTSRLHFRQEPDGTFRFIQNCPQPANCYPAQ